MGKAESRFVALLDWFIGHHYDTDINLLYRARLLAGMLVVLGMTMLLYVPYMLFLAPVGPATHTVTLQFAAPLVVVYVLLLALIRWRGMLVFCSHSLLFVYLSVLLGAVYYTGGPALSPATPMLLVPVILAYSLTGLAGGLFWTAGILIVQSVFFYLMLGGYDFPYRGDRVSDGYTLAFNWIMAVGNSAAVMVVYERISHRLSDQLARERAAFAHQAHHDALTGLYNRARFDEELERALLRAERSGTQVGLLYMDLDGFKPVNDTLGHAAGDVVLQAVAERLKARVRRADAVARLGGDEFAVIVEQLREPADLGPLADGILASVAEPVDSLPGSPRVSGSIGMAVYPGHAADAGALLRQADQAMYQAKRRHGVWVMAGSPPAPAQSSVSP